MRILRAGLDRKAGWPLIWVGLAIAVTCTVLAIVLWVDVAKVSDGWDGWRSARLPIFLALFGLASIARGIQCLRGRALPGPVVPPPGPSRRPADGRLP